VSGPGPDDDDDDADEIARKMGVCSNASLRGIVLRATLVLTALVSLMAATTVVMYTFASVTASKAAQLNNAGRRRMLTTQTVSDLRELILADGQLGTVEALAASAENALRRYQRIHDGLRLGDAGLGLPKRRPGEGEPQELTYLYYGEPGRTFTLGDDSTATAADFESVGLDPLVRHFWDVARRVLTTYANATAPRPNRTLSGLLSVPGFRELWDMERGSLQAKLGLAVGYYTTSDAKVVDSLESEAYTVLSVEIIVLAAAYLMVYEGISSALVSEHLRGDEVKNLVPSVIRRGTPDLARAFDNAGSGAGTSSRSLAR